MTIKDIDNLINDLYEVAEMIELFKYTFGRDTLTRTIITLKFLKDIIIKYNLQKILKYENIRRI